MPIIYLIKWVLSSGFRHFLCKDFVTTSGRKPSGTAAVEARVITYVENKKIKNLNPLFRGGIDYTAKYLTPSIKMYSAFLPLCHTVERWSLRTTCLLDMGCTTRNEPPIFSTTSTSDKVCRKIGFNGFIWLPSLLSYEAYCCI